MNPSLYAGTNRSELVEWTLRFGIILMCAGTVWRDLTAEDPIFEYLFVILKLDESTALWIAHGGSYALLAGIPFLFFDRAWPVLLGMSCWLGLRTVTHALDEVWHPELIPLEDAVRYLGPVALAGLLAFRGEETSHRTRMAWVDPLLRIATSLTFIGHGIAALFLKGEFIDFILDAGTDVFGVRIAQETAETLIFGIGMLDLVVALLLLLPFRLRWVAGWMVFWGLLTSLARITRYGETGVPRALLRAMNWAAPLVLLIHWHLNGTDASADS